MVLWIRLTKFGLKLEPIEFTFKPRGMTSCSSKKHLLPSHQGDFSAQIILKAACCWPSPAMAMLPVPPGERILRVSLGQSALQYCPRHSSLSDIKAKK